MKVDQQEVSTSIGDLINPQQAEIFADSLVGQNSPQIRLIHMSSTSTFHLCKSQHNRIVENPKKLQTRRYRPPKFQTAFKQLLKASQLCTNIIHSIRLFVLTVN